MRHAMMALALTAMVGCAPASGSGPQVDGSGWIVIPEDTLEVLGDPLGDGTERVRFESAIHRYNPATDMTTIRLGGAPGGYFLQISWTGDTPMQGGTGLGDPRATLDLQAAPDDTGEPYYADDQTAPGALLAIDFPAADWAAQAGRRTTGTISGRMERQDGTTLDILSGKVSAIRH